MPKEVKVEICMNDSAVHAAKTFWVDNRGYTVATSMTNGTEYTAFERKGATGTDQKKIGEEDADGTDVISVLVFTKDT